MALATTNISVTLVKNTLGADSTAVSSLVQDELVNPWGINTPNLPQQIRCWGKIVQPAPFELGMFRGYEHTWRCYNIKNRTIDEPLSYYERGNVRVNIGFVPELSTATSWVNHYFDVWFSRNNVFPANEVGVTKIATDSIVADAGQLVIDINPAVAPDGTPLTPDSTFYLKVQHKTSPERRWDSRIYINDANIIVNPLDAESFIIAVQVNHDVFTNDLLIEKDGASFVYKNVAGFMMAYVLLLNGYSYSKNVTATFEINNQPDFLGVKSFSTTDSFTIPAATRSGGVLTKGAINGVINGDNTFSQWSANEVYYGRVKIDGGAWSTTTYGGNISITLPT